MKLDSCEKTPVFRWLLVALCLSACTRTPDVPIFLWHSVGPGDGPRDVSVDEFEAQLKLIEAFGATPITLAQLYDAREKQTPLPKRAVVLTFDDGRAELFEHALPVLKNHQATAELFVVTDWIAEAPAERRTFTDETGVHRALTWTELEQMVKSGAFVIESHSLSHPHLLQLDGATQSSELSRSRTLIQQRLKVPSDFFAYPFGSLDSKLKARTEKAGYRGAVTVEAHGGGPWGLTRISVWRESTAVVRQALVAAFGEQR